ncbi:MAG: type 1 glutamine amidotransferase [Candidatus Bathyarchaeota archaeon]|jgi:GMP synthase (glutamine-hydrolysing)
MRILLVQNDEIEGLGAYEQHLKRFRVDHTVFHAYDMEEEDVFPPVDLFDAFIIGATPISANDVDDHLFLRREWEVLGEIVESGKPCLGVCCGGQMLARVLGGGVVRSPEREVGGYEVHLTEEGLGDPLFQGFPEEFPVFHWHSDMFQVPPGGSLLAVGDPCPVQAFGHGNLRGVIFHLEIDRREAARWADAYPGELEAVEKTKEQVLDECRAREPDMRWLANRLMENFLGMA